MTREKLIEFLSKIVILGQHMNGTFGVLLPSLNCLKDFSKAIDLKLEEVPDWLMPTIEYRTQKKLSASSILIILECNFINFKGRSLNTVFISDSFNAEQRLEIEQYISPCLTKQNSLIYFEDNPN